jgi:hypothetical protein
MSEAKSDSLNCHVGRCKSCKHFERGHWLPEYGGGEQMGGNCKALCRVLGLTNSYLVWHDAIHVQESFGCSLFSPNAANEPRSDSK